MERVIIQHHPRPLSATLCRRFEIEQDIVDSPPDQRDIVATCPGCGCTMMYRGRGRLRNGKLVHCFECVHSHREVYSVSIVIAQP